MPQNAEKYNVRGNTNMEFEKPAQRHFVELKFEIKRSYARVPAPAEVKNLSLSGAFIRTEDPLKTAEKINVFLTVSGRTRRIAAQVIWVGERGAGIKFMPFNNRDLQIVDDIIYYATEKTQSTRDLLDTILSKVA